MIEKIQELLDPFTRIGINKLDGQILGLFIHAADKVLEILQESRVPKNEAYKLLTYSHIYANVVAVTPYKTTDRWLDLFTDPVKLMFLYTGRNKKTLDSRPFFNYDRNLASLWFAQFVLPVIGCTDDVMQSNIERHYKNINRKCVFLPQSTHAFFWSDYFSPEVAKKVKKRLNSSIDLPPILNIANPKNIAIITGNWKPTHAVVRSVGKFIYDLAQQYNLTLIHLGKISPEADLSIFKNVSQVSIFDGKLDLSEIQMVSFGAAIFLDHGLTPESVYLANMRLAPVQIACNGHPVSGHFKEIDYFISGQDIEKADAHQNYSESLILVPGSGAAPCLPSYVPKKPQLGSKINVAVPWNAIKYNIPMFRCLKSLQDVGVHLVFLPGNSIHRYQASIPVRMSMLEYFGKNITIMPNLPYAKYMEALENCHFSVDSFPFGGYNTVLDSLWCGRPVITLFGNHWYNRAASYLLHKVGLDDLITHSYVQYMEVASSLARDTNKLLNLTAKISQVKFDWLAQSNDSKELISGITKLIGVTHE